MSSAKIQFTVKLDDIPKEVLSRLKEITDMLGVVLKDSNTSLNEVSDEKFLNAAETLQRIRDNISYIDAVYSDCYNILVGYAGYKAKAFEQKQDTDQKQEQKDN